MTSTEQIPQLPQRSRLARREIPSLPSAGRGMRNVPAWLISLLLHIGIVTAVGALWVRAPKGTGGEAERPVGVAVVYEVAGSEEYLLDGSGNSNATGNQGAESLSNALPSAASSVSEADPLSDLLPGAAAAAGDTSAAAGDLGLGEGGAQLGGNRGIPKVKTTVFGIEGEGTRFLYVFDRSDSMNGYGGRPLRAAKTELLKSLESLGPVHQFQVIFYNDSPLPYGGLGGQGPQLLKGDDQSKRLAQRFVRDMGAIGGTRHIEALRMALAMGPDVVFFLTDADFPELSESELEDLHRRSARSGTTLHTIQFGAGPNLRSGGWIRHLAEGTAGKYRYIDVSKVLGSD